MRRYTLYLFDANIRSLCGLELICASDGEAINASLDRAAGRGLELWSGERQVLSTAATPCCGNRADAPPPPPRLRTRSAAMR